MSNRNDRIDKMLGKNNKEAFTVTRDDGHTFASWLYALDDICEKELELSFLDLGDFNSWDCWNDGLSPREGYDELCDQQDLDPRDYF